MQLLLSVNRISYYSESRNGKMNSESCNKEGFNVSKESKWHSKEDVTASRMMHNNDITDVVSNDNVEDVGLDLKFDRKEDDVMDVNDVSSLEVPRNSLRETKEDQVDNLPKSDKLLVSSIILFKNKLLFY